MKDLSEYKDSFLLFLEAGFIAINQYDEDAAIKLFKACELFQPDNFLIKIGMGYLYMNKLELQQSCQAFEEVLEKDPENDIAQTFLGFVLSLMPDQVEKGEKLLEASAKRAPDPETKETARTALEFINTFIKKTSVEGGPASVKQK